MANGYIKLKLEYIFPEAGIDRTVVVPKDWALAFLHEVIQKSFGYLDYHEHEFIDAKKTHYVREEDPNWDMIPSFSGEVEEQKLDYDFKISSLLKKKGDTLDYVYDLGDYNEIKITHLGLVADLTAADFDSHGPDLIEDSHGPMGGTPGIFKLLSSKKPTAKYKECVEWLEVAFHKSPAAVLDVPSPDAIYCRVNHLVNLVNLAKVD